MLTTFYRMTSATTGSVYHQGQRQEQREQNTDTGMYDDTTSNEMNFRTEHQNEDSAVTTTTSSSSYVPFGHSTIFVAEQSRYFDYFYSNIEEMEARHTRFPSVDERVKLYMTSWYTPPCEENVDGHVLYTYPDSMSSTYKSTVIVQPVTVVTSTNINEGVVNPTEVPPRLSIDTTYSRTPLCFLYNRSVIEECTDNLCNDARQYYTPYVDQYFVTNPYSDDPNVPLFAQHGDANYYRANLADRTQQSSSITSMPQENVESRLYLGNPNIPVFKKFRGALSETERATIIQSNTCFGTGQRRTVATAVSSESTEMMYHDAFLPIISIVSNFGRHFHPLIDIIDSDSDSRPWDQKVSKAVYRGLCTGQSKSAYKSKKIRERENVSDYDFCQNIPRCRLVFEYHNSSLVDAKLTHTRSLDAAYTVRGRLMIGNSLSIEDLLQHKGIIMIEGNDVSSGLKWALFSKSVVLTQKPRFTSWAMEELLQPWVHYIPIADDLSDVEEKVQWMIDNDEKAKEIAHNGHLWMTDMMFHPQAMQDHEAIIRETFRRYRLHFRHDPSIWL